MKKRIHIILPFALAIILPGLNFFSNSEASGKVPKYFAEKWLYGSIVMYILWYLLQILSNIRKKHRNLIITGAVTTFSVLVYGLFALYIFKIPNTIKWVFIIKLFFAAILFFIIQFALKAKESISRLQLQNEQILIENYKVQLQELRTKVDPHFLFNSFNTLRTMIRNNHPSSEQFVMSLSNFYRLTLTLNKTSTTSLKEEIDVLKSYLFLIQTRNEGAIKVSIDIEESLLQKQIPVLSLQILAENCFKHNRTSSSHPLEIKIYTENDYILVKNNRLPKLTVGEISGFGLENLMQRYALLKIPDGMIKNSNDESFEVKLKLI
ncbi:sensor histidine kinase [Epilithonimonas mollis]|uniref:Histidine kinase n=1 Tax=Epilithonimonas mollis TaxID=216903 RepID=A0A1M6MWU3_9FLAO|nr:histidine kinase [Epilithonimonas mollis]SHJ87955.1 Histidine kinase [Epilithonimonas mollis]